VFLSCLRCRFLLLAALVIAVGVSTAMPTPQAVKPEEKRAERYAHLFSSSDPKWILESEIPVKSKALAGTSNDTHAHHLSPTESQSGSVQGVMLWEVSAYPPGSKPTSEQRKAAENLVEQSYQSAKRNGWFDFNKGKADGYVPADVPHYSNEKYLLDEAILDPERPEFLMYYDTPQGKKLAGYMFLANKTLARGPQIGGPLTVWHYHYSLDEYCFMWGLLIVGQPEKGKCTRGVPQQRSPEMLHVWLIDHPAGQFSSQMNVTPDVLKLGLERRLRNRGF